MDRLFLDANILFSAAWRRDSGMRRLWRLRDVRLLISNLAVEEVFRNLDEPRKRADARRLLEGMTIIAQPQARPVAEGEVLPMKDRHILQAATSCRATHLITGDVSHFSPLFGHRVRGVEVLTFAEYLESRRRRGLDTGDRSARNR